MATVIIKKKKWEKWKNCTLASDGMTGEKLYIKIGTPEKQIEFSLSKWEIKLLKRILNQ